MTNNLATKAPLILSLQLTNRSSITGLFDANNWVLPHPGAIKWIDNNNGHTNLPAALINGTIFQVDPLFGTLGANNYIIQFFHSGVRLFWRHRQNGFWGAWREISSTAVA